MRDPRPRSTRTDEFRLRPLSLLVERGHCARNPKQRTNAMTQNPAMKGEKIYEFEFDITGVTDYGVSKDAILAGKETDRQHGAWIDLAVNGRGQGRL